ncbi:transporter [Paenibacillus puldeungensis]|uniref:Transporter n=1 Tax=Paenibacillus puldeungensis TaxID=696536 RepID=A0ABW3RWT8_9BACL
MAFMPPQQGAQGLQGPTSPPPQFTPQQPQATTFAVDPGAIAGCRLRFTYVWLRNGDSFWFYPTFVGRTSVAGYRWNGFFWMYAGLDLRQITSFTCF